MLLLPLLPRAPSHLSPCYLFTFTLSRLASLHPILSPTWPHSPVSLLSVSPPSCSFPLSHFIWACFPSSPLRASPSPTCLMPSLLSRLPPPPASWRLRSSLFIFIRFKFRPSYMPILILSLLCCFFSSPTYILPLVVTSPRMPQSHVPPCLHTYPDALPPPADWSPHPPASPSTSTPRLAFLHACHGSLDFSPASCCCSVSSRCSVRPRIPSTCGGTEHFGGDFCRVF